MALGLGHRYYVHIVKHFSGPLEECISFMIKYRPTSIEQWFELRPIPDLKQDPIVCFEYSCDLVEDASQCK